MNLENAVAEDEQAWPEMQKQFDIYPGNRSWISAGFLLCSLFNSELCAIRRYLASYA